jgi:tight adherence protein B
MTGAVLVFALVLTIIFGTYWMFVLAPEQVTERAVRARLRGPRSQKLTASVIKARERLSGLRSLDTVLEKSGALVAPLRELVARSGMRTSIGTIILASVFAAVATLALVSRLSPYFFVAAAAGVLAGFVPFLYVRRAAAKRMALFEEQFPEAIDLIARALRAGHALPTSLQMVADEIAAPVGSEFRLLFDQQNFGMSLPDALKAFGNRIPLIDARFFVTAVLTQREMGGNLSEVLDRLAAVIRDRFKVKRQVRAISAHGRITGVVLGFLPPAVAAILFVLSPQQIRLLVDDPIGVDMVIGAIVLQIVGVLIIRRIVRVEY